MLRALTASRAIMTDVAAAVNVAASSTTKRVPIPRNGVDYRGTVVLAPMVRSGELPSRLMALKYGADLVWGRLCSLNPACKIVYEICSTILIPCLPLCRPRNGRPRPDRLLHAYKPSDVLCRVHTQSLEWQAESFTGRCTSTASRWGVRETKREERGRIYVWVYRSNSMDRPRSTPTSTTRELGHQTR